MRTYILFNTITSVAEAFDSFADAEKSATKQAGDNPGKFSIGKLTHNMTREQGYNEFVLIDQANPKDGYIPQVGDVFVKEKSKNKRNGAISVFERKLSYVNADTVVVINKHDEQNPQLMPTYQWFRWIRGATFVKRAGVLIE